jgi:peptidyl-tRNA hydrolase
MAGEVRPADESAWKRLKAEVEYVVIRDAGFTQVAPGTETGVGNATPQRASEHRYSA